MVEPQPLRPAAPPAVAVDGLSKTYTDQKRRQPVDALTDLTLSIPQGSFFGLLGPNGAGKSTLINILAGLVVRSSGSARVMGWDVDRDYRAARRAIGVVPQELNLDPFFTPREALDVQAGLYGVPASARRTDAILSAVGLSQQADSYARRLSGGMRRRLLVAKAMVHSPAVLVLDEPTAGVDIELRRQLWDYVRELNRSGTTILLTTHYLEEAEALCDRIAIIDKGRLIAHDTTRALLQRLDSKELTLNVQPPVEWVPPDLASFNVRVTAPGRLTFLYPPSRVSAGLIMARVTDAGLRVIDVTTKETDLEDIFLQLTGGRDRDRRRADDEGKEVKL
jgi:ABC-2 type transport system ATP-binding protein